MVHCVFNDREELIQTLAYIRADILYSAASGTGVFASLARNSRLQWLVFTLFDVFYP